MNQKTLTFKLLNDLSNENFQAYGNLMYEQKTREIFELLITLLKHKNYKVRFFALFNLIEDFKKLIFETREQYVPVIIRLLMDEHSIIVDRAGWYFGIMEGYGIDKLIEYYESPNLRLKCNIFWVLSHNYHLNTRKQEVVNLFLKGLKDENITVRYSAFSYTASISPFRNYVGSETCIYDFDLSHLHETAYEVGYFLCLSKLHKKSRTFSMKLLNQLHQELTKKKQL